MDLTQPIIIELQKRHLSIDSTNTDGMTALMTASKLGHSQVANQLICVGASLFMRDNIHFRSARDWISHQSTSIPIKETDDPKSSVVTSEKIMNCTSQPGSKMVYHRHSRAGRCHSAPVSGRTAPRLNDSKCRRRLTKTPELIEPKQVDSERSPNLRSPHRSRPQTSHTSHARQSLSDLKQPACTDRYTGVDAPLRCQLDGGPDIGTLLDMYAVQSSPDYREGLSRKQMIDKINNPPIPWSERQEIVRSRFQNLLSLQSVDSAFRRLAVPSGAVRRSQSVLSTLMSTSPRALESPRVDRSGTKPGFKSTIRKLTRTNKPAGKLEPEV